MGKIKIGKIANRNIVAGDPNLVTKNELYLDVKKDNPLQIDLQRRGSNGTLKSILSSKKITIQPKKRPTYQLHQIKMYNRALLKGLSENNTDGLYEWLAEAFNKNFYNIFWISNINLGTLSKKRVYHIISLRSLYVQQKVDRNPSTFISRPCSLYINKGDIYTDHMRVLFNNIRDVSNAIFMNSDKKDHLPYVVFVTQHEDLLTRKELGLPDTFQGIKIDVPFLCFPQELGKEHGFGTTTNITNDYDNIIYSIHNPYGCSLSNCRWGNYLNKFPTWKDYYTRMVPSDEGSNEYDYIGAKVQNYRVSVQRRESTNNNAFSYSNNQYYINPFYRGQALKISGPLLGLNLYNKGRHHLKWKNIWKDT